MNNANNVSPELQFLLNQRRLASEGQTNGDPKNRRRPTLRGAGGAVKLPTGSLPARTNGLVSRKSHDGDMVCSPSSRSPQNGSSWPARREIPTRDPISSATDNHRPPLLNQRVSRASTLNQSQINSAMRVDWTSGKAGYWDSQANEDVVKELNNKLRQTQQGHKEVCCQNRQLREECRHYTEWNASLIDTHNNLMDNQRLVQQECAEFAALNKSLMESQERLQEECGHHEVKTRRLASELSDYQVQNRNLTESHMEECRDFMAHERDLMATQTRLMDDYKLKEAENDNLKHTQQRLSDEYREQLHQTSYLVEVKDRLSDEYKEQLHQNSFLVDAKDRLSDEYKEQLHQNSFLVDARERLHVECAAYKAQLAEALLTNDKQGAPEQELTQSEPDPEADMEGDPEEAEQEQVDKERLPVQSNPQSDACSEGRLRRVLTSHTSTTEELRQALAAVDSLMSEARRELASRELRERRAGYEQLHNATAGRSESALEEAIAVAYNVGVDADDIEKAEAKLEELRSISDEERAAQEAQRELVERKRRSFQLVKQGKALALKELLGDDGSDVSSKSWAQWKDHAGRSLFSYAKELRATTVLECLERMVSNDSEVEAESVESNLPTEDHNSQQEISEELPAIVLTCGSQRPLLATEDLPEGCSPQHVTRVTTPGLAPWSPESDATRVATKSDSEWPATRANLEESLYEARSPSVPEDREAACYLSLSAQEEEALRLQAFKAVVKDDTETLADIMTKVPSDTWSSWQNKAAKDLLTLAQERRSPNSYSMMAKELGILQERKRESFEERETVWVLFPGEVQARHATVLEDTPGDATEVLLEFWDNDGPPSKVDHALVMKTA